MRKGEGSPQILLWAGDRLEDRVLLSRIVAVGSTHGSAPIVQIASTSAQKVDTSTEARSTATTAADARERYEEQLPTESSTTTSASTRSSLTIPLTQKLSTTVSREENSGSGSLTILLRSLSVSFNEDPVPWGSLVTPAIAITAVRSTHALGLAEARANDLEVDGLPVDTTVPVQGLPADSLEVKLAMAEGKGADLLAPQFGDDPASWDEAVDRLMEMLPLFGGESESDLEASAIPAPVYWVWWRPR